MHKLVTGATALLTLVVLAQFFLAGRAALTADHDPHRVLGLVTVALALVVLLAAAAARLPRRVLGRAALAAGLLLLQPVLAGAGKGVDDVTLGGLLVGLHAVNGALVLAALGALLRALRTLGRPARPAEEPAPAAATS